MAFPALDQREGADPTWADTMDTLTSASPAGSKTLGVATRVAHPTSSV